METRAEKVPLLLKGAVARNTSNDVLPGAYCSRRHVWIVDDEPIVAKGGLPELFTKTEAVRETDDKRSAGFAELLTKTRQELESDDNRVNSRAVLEMITKTATQTERDD